MTQEFVTMRREVVEQALEALSLALSDVDWRKDSPTQPVICKAYNATCAELEQPQGEQEPVAWIRTEWSSRNVTFDGPPAVPSVRDELTKPVWTPLYTHQQNLNCKSTQARLAAMWGYIKEQPQREPLTHQQIDAIAESMPGGLDGFLKGWGWRQFSRAIEAAHNIK